MRLAPVDDNWEVVEDARADANGEVTATITIPENAVDGEEWQAMVTTTERANITRAESRLFVIDE